MVCLRSSAVEPPVGSQRRVLGVQPTGDLLAEYEGAAAGAVVRAAAVVPHAAAELREDEHCDLFGGIVVLQVLEEVHDRAGELAQELRLGGVLVGVDVIATVLCVEDARPDPGQMHPGHVPQAPGDRVAGVFDVGTRNRESPP